jgi:TetR/AcrR family transcriptional regulator, transcriptional repressor for nem operon
MVHTRVMTPRPPAFDEAAVIDAAIETFTRHGYEGADASILCREAGLSRSSLYNSFGSREALFVRALGEYSRRGVEEAAALAEAEGPALSLLRSRLLDGVQAQAREGSRDGCLTVNVGIELGRSLPEAAAIVDADREAWVRCYAALLERATRQGDLAFDGDPLALGAALHTLLAGLRVAARTLAPDELGREVDAVLGTWATAAGRELLGRLASRGEEAR